MNTHKDARPLNWRKFFWVGLVLLVVAYAYGSPTLEKWTGLELPSLLEEEPIQGEDRDRDLEFESDPSMDAGSSARVSSDGSTGRTGSVSAPHSFELKKIGKNKFESPAGLIYSMGPGGEHRVDHVLRHAQDNPSRPVHSVFEGDRNSILEVIDEAYELIKNDSNRVKSSREGNRTEYTIDMKKKIGYEGGQKGKRNNFPTLKRLKLILQNQHDVVTAYPYR